MMIFMNAFLKTVNAQNTGAIITTVSVETNQSCNRYVTKQYAGLLLSFPGYLI